MSPLLKTSTSVLDRKEPLELVLEIPSFAGGENTIGEDQELKVNEARVIENWDAVSLGGMIRSRGFTSLASVAGTSGIDMMLHHYEGSTVRNYALVAGNLRYINGAALTQTDASAFTSGVLTHGVTAGSKAWMTNSTDNLKFTTIAGTIAAPTGTPPSARDRIYYHKQRLIAEGGGVTIYGSRAGSGNWAASANTWTASGDAWSIDLPDLTQGLAPAFPTGDVITAFTKHQAFTLYNFPNIAYQPVQASHGCSAPYSIAQGVEGLFFLSQYPTLGIYLWDNGGNFINLTINEDWITDVKLTTRIFGYYRENEYGILYASIAGGQSVPDTWRIYDTKFGVWKKRPINASVAEKFGYPCVLEKPSNVLVFGSAVNNIVYTMEDTSNSDNTYATSARYTTKDFTSKDFRTIEGGSFPIDEVRMKLLKVTVSYYGTTGNIIIAWNSDRGTHVGSQTITMSSSVGALINTTFTVNTSSLVTPPPTKTVTRSFTNGAIGRRFSFDITNSNTGERPKIKKIKIFSIALEEA